LRLEGGLFSPDLLEALAAADLPGQKPQDFGLPPGRSLTAEIAAVFSDARALWQVFQNRLERLPADDLATSDTREVWVIPLLHLLGYDLRYNPRALEVDGQTYPISHMVVDGRGERESTRAGEHLTLSSSPALTLSNTPVHIVGYRQELGRLAPSGRPRLSPHALVQEYLNRSEALWGIVTNGRTLRLLRDSTFVRRQAYLEFDLETIFSENRFSDFVLLYRLLHRTRLPAEGARPEDCLLETYYQESIQQGGRVREHLRDGVEQAITLLANGFLSSSPTLTFSRSPALPDPALSLYKQLLRLIYRFLFLLVAEERGLMGQNPIYLEHYGVSRLRRLCENRAAYTDDTDLWHSLRALWVTLTDEKMAALLGVPPLNGELFAHQDLDDALITNCDLLNAFWYLSFYQEGSAPPRRVNYAALDTEELGSVYESLLDYHPAIQLDSRGKPTFALTPGSERKSTGSYYTPPALVSELVKSALEPVIEEKLRAARGKENVRTREQESMKPGEHETRRTGEHESHALTFSHSQSSPALEQALLSIKVLDPACGSGHFLLAATRRLGKELARLRSGEDEPAPEYVHQGVRDAITHCIYGVDKNPLAVELCRVSLWLEGHEKDKPLTFLDHHIRCGDSLAGLTDLAALEDGIPDEAYRPLGSDDRAVARQAKTRNARDRQMTLFQHGFATQNLSRFAEEMQRLADLPEETIEQVRAKSAAYHRLENSPEFVHLRRAADTWMAAFFQPYTAAQPPLTTAAVQEALSRGDLTDPRQGGFVLQTAQQERRFFHWALEFAEAFATPSQALPLSSSPALQNGFDVILGNPPFMGGLKISGNFGEAYRKWMETAFVPFGGTADLCAAFFRRAYALLRPGGRLGMIATNTLGQGDTRESGLKVILAQGGRIAFAQRFVKWPGQANVEVNLVVLSRPAALPLSSSHALPLSTSPLLDGHPVPSISSRLDAEPEAEPVRLKQNEGKAFQGDIVRGIGFVLEPGEAEALIARDPRNADCLFPYLNGEDLNSHPEQQPSRWVICFHDWDLERARQYPDLLRIVEERVKPEREHLTGPGDKRNREYWWQFGAYRAGMRQAIAPLRRVLVRSRVSELHSMVFVAKGWIYSDQTIVFAFDDDYHFALLQSGVHEVWLRQQASSLRTDIRYTPTDCFDTFPFPPLEMESMRTREGGESMRVGEGESGRTGEMPQAFQQAAQVGAAYHEHRRQIMLARQLGLTKTYNLFHNPACQDADILRLRELHAEMDRAILACYGWDDIDPGHDFYQNDRGQTRYTLSPEARREVLARLVELNLEMAGREK